MLAIPFLRAGVEQDVAQVASMFSLSWALRFRRLPGGGWVREIDGGAERR